MRSARLMLCVFLFAPSAFSGPTPSASDPFLCHRLIEQMSQDAESEWTRIAAYFRRDTPPPRETMELLRGWVLDAPEPAGNPVAERLVDELYGKAVEWDSDYYDLTAALRLRTYLSAPVTRLELAGVKHALETIDPKAHPKILLLRHALVERAREHGMTTAMEEVYWRDLKNVMGDTSGLHRVDARGEAPVNYRRWLLDIGRREPWGLEYGEHGETFVLQVVGAWACRPESVNHGRALRFVVEFAEKSGPARRSGDAASRFVTLPRAVTEALIAYSRLPEGKRNPEMSRRVRGIFSEWSIAAE